jgi:peroxiredoxin
MEVSPMQTERRWVCRLLIAAVLAGSALAIQARSARDEGSGDAGSSRPEAKEKPAAAQIGQDAPDFQLTDTAGNLWRLADYRNKIVVLEWLNQDCPFSNFKTGAGPRAKALCEKFRDKGVVWVGIDSTHYQTAEKDAEYARENKIPYPILMDHDGKVGKLYGAKTTPHVFIISGGKLAYAGALDNDPRKEKPEAEYRNYVEEALEALLAGKNVPVSQTQSWGCTVKYKPD